MFEDILGELDEIVEPLDNTDIPEKYRKEIINKKLIDNYNKIIDEITNKNIRNIQYQGWYNY